MLLTKLYEPFWSFFPPPVPCCFLQFYLFSSFAGLLVEPTLLRVGKNWRFFLKKKQNPSSQALLGEGQG